MAHKHYDRVLSGSLVAWLPGEEVPQGLEEQLAHEVANAVVAFKNYITMDGQRREIATLVLGSRINCPLDWVTAVLGTSPIISMSGVVTSARSPKLEGNLIRPRTGDPRSWMFASGWDSLRFAKSTGIIDDPLVEQFGFIATPKAEVRNLRKRILGFKE